MFQITPNLDEVVCKWGHKYSDRGFEGVGMKTNPVGGLSRKSGISQQRKPRMGRVISDLMKPPGEGSGFAIKIAPCLFKHLEEGLGGFALHWSPDLDRRKRRRRGGEKVIGFLHDSFLKPGIAGPVGVFGFCKDHDAAGESVQAMNHKRLGTRDFAHVMAHHAVSGLGDACRNAEPACGLVQDNEGLRFE